MTLYLVKRGHQLTVYFARPHMAEITGLEKTWKQWTGAHNTQIPVSLAQDLFSIYLEDQPDESLHELELTCRLRGDPILFPEDDA